MKAALLTAVVAAVAIGGVSANASTYPFPTTPYTGNDATYGGANLVVTFNADGSTTTIAPAEATANYDGSDDALVGVVNDSGKTLTSFDISGYNIFGFDGDGIDTFIPGFTATAGNPDTTTYGGPDGYFTNIVDGASIDSGTVNFVGGIANLGSDFFSLEQPISIDTPPIITPTVPEPASIAILAVGLLGLGALLRRRGTI